MGVGKLSQHLRVLVLPRTGVWFPAPMSGNSQIRGNPALTDSKPSSGFLRYHIYAHMHRDTHKHN